MGASSGVLYITGFGKWSLIKACSGLWPLHKTFPGVLDVPGLVQYLLLETSSDLPSLLGLGSYPLHGSFLMSLVYCQVCRIVFNESMSRSWTSHGSSFQVWYIAGFVELSAMKECSSLRPSRRLAPWPSDGQFYLIPAHCRTFRSLLAPWKKACSGALPWHIPVCSISLLCTVWRFVLDLWLVRAARAFCSWMADFLHVIGSRPCWDWAWSYYWRGPLGSGTLCDVQIRLCWTILGPLTLACAHHFNSSIWQDVWVRRRGTYARGMPISWNCQLDVHGRYVGWAAMKNAIAWALGCDLHGTTCTLQHVWIYS